MLKDELKEMLRGAGREIAIEQMAAACKTASTKVVMKNQLDLLYYGAVHVIATRIYNGVRQQGLCAKELERELHFLIDAPKEGMEFSSPGGRD